jgi:DNA-binding CsgD family transcriptional regulator
MGAYFALFGVRHELLLPLPPEGRDDHRLLFFRTDGPDFTDRDVQLLTLLRPHVVALHLRQVRRREGLAPLTPRQVEILTLVAAGCTNGQVSRTLSVSEATVRKHLENAFARLQVSSRTAAVAKLLA